MRMIVDPLSPAGEQRDVATVLHGLAAQENCDGEPYDQMQAAADYIREMEATHARAAMFIREYIEASEKRDAILYKLARLARNTDGLHPSSSGPAVGALLLELRLMDGDRYAKEVM